MFGAANIMSRRPIIGRISGTSGWRELPMQNTEQICTVAPLRFYLTPQSWSYVNQIGDERNGRIYLHFEGSKVPSLMFLVTLSLCWRLFWKCSGNNAQFICRLNEVERQIVALKAQLRSAKRQLQVYGLINVYY